jgi:hypothetical protein
MPSHGASARLSHGAFVTRERCGIAHKGISEAGARAGAGCGSGNGGEPFAAARLCTPGVWIAARESQREWIGRPGESRVEAQRDLGRSGTWEARGSTRTIASLCARARGALDGRPRARGAPKAPTGMCGGVIGAGGGGRGGARDGGGKIFLAAKLVYANPCNSSAGSRSGAQRERAHARN